MEEFIKHKEHHGVDLSGRANHHRPPIREGIVCANKPYRHTAGPAG
mgnify:CR=1 FL=1